ncbi:MAG: hypothetical protein ACW976_04030 [Candidatus Ranarchaeia archaeon]|jgi:chromosome segregation ATPase
MENVTKTDELLKQLKEDVDSLRTSFQDQITSIANEVDGLINKTPEVSHYLDNLEKRIGEVEEQISRQRGSREILETEVAELKDNIGEAEVNETQLENEVKKLSETTQDLTNQVEQVNREIEKAVTEKTTLEERVKTMTRKVEETEKLQEAELKEKRDSVVTAMQAVERMQNEAPVLDYLLAEGSRDTPELEILTVLGEKPEASVDEIKQKARVPAAIALRSIRKLHDMDLIEFDEPNNQVRLLKQIQ